MGNFAASVKGWSEKAKRHADLIWKQSAQDVAEIAQQDVGSGGRMRVDTGFLRASIRSSLTTPDPIRADFRPVDGAAAGSYTPGGEVTATIAGAELGDTIYVTWTASYAGAREAYDGFVAAAAQEWQRVVAENAARVK